MITSQITLIHTYFIFINTNLFKYAYAENAQHEDLADISVFLFFCCKLYINTTTHFNIISMLIFLPAQIPSVQEASYIRVPFSG